MNAVEINQEYFDYSQACIDAMVVKQYNTERLYFPSVLARVVEIIKFLTERGLALRGHDELLGSAHNGIFLGIIELVSKFDPFLAGHVEKQRLQQQQHQRSISYLSSTTCNELVNQMGRKLLNSIIDDIKRAKYYSISIDSTPDACKVDRAHVFSDIFLNTVPYPLNVSSNSWT